MNLDTIQLNTTPPDMISLDNSTESVISTEIDIPQNNLIAEKSIDDCCVCMENPSTNTAMECGHNIMCAECYILVDKCPLCRAVITANIKHPAVICPTHTPAFIVQNEYPDGGGGGDSDSDISPLYFYKKILTTTCMIIFTTFTLIIILNVWD